MPAKRPNAIPRWRGRHTQPFNDNRLSGNPVRRAEQAPEIERGEIGAEETADLDSCEWIVTDNSRQSVASVIIRGFFCPNVVRYDLEFADIFASSDAYFIYPIEKLRIHRSVVRQ